MAKAGLPRSEKHHFEPLKTKSHKAYLCSCMDHRFIEPLLREFRGLADTHYVYLETEAGGAPSFGAEPPSARLAYMHEGIQARIMGWAAHGDGCGGYPGRSNDELRDKLVETLRERARDFPDVHHYGLFATQSKDGGADVEVWDLGPPNPKQDASSKPKSMTKKKIESTKRKPRAK